MIEQIKEIGQRMKALREILDISAEEMAKATDITVDEYQNYENGEADFSFSFLYSASNKLGVDVTDLMTGDSPKLHVACLTRKGEGYKIERRKAYSYLHLAYTFKDKNAEPFMVTVAQSEADKPLTLHAHEGQEFNYVVSGTLYLQIGDAKYELSEGDSLYFDSTVPHAMKAVAGDAQFLAVVIKPHV